ncbi:NlpC/P60 family protein [Actinopolymorpha pittospori]
MPHHRRRTPWSALLAFGTATVIVVAAVPGSSSAEPVTSSNIEQVRKQVDQLYAHAEQVTEQANALGEKLKVIDRRVHTLNADVARQQQTVESLRSDIGKFAAEEYRAGGTDTTVRLLVAENPTEFMAQMSTADALSKQQADQLRGFESARKRLSEQQAAQAASLAEFRKAKQAVDTRRQTALHQAAAAKAILDRLTEEQRRRLAAAAEQRRKEQERAARERAERESTPESPESPGSPKPPSTPEPPPPPSSGRGATALAFAKQQLGEPYVFAAAGPDSWDCSGLTMKAWEQAGVSLPHSAHEQYNVSAKVSKSNLQPGDLVFFYSDMHHVGLYVGNGEVIHAPRPGEGVQYIKMAYMPYAGAARPG